MRFFDFSIIGRQPLKFSKSASGIYIGVYKAPRPLYMVWKQSFIYFVATCNIGVKDMSNHNQLNWTDFLLCIGMELAFFKNGERPIQEQLIAEKIIELGGRL